MRMTPEREQEIRKRADAVGLGKWLFDGNEVKELMTEIDALEHERDALDMQNKDYERVTKYLCDQASEREKTNQQLTTELVSLQAENEKLKADVDLRPLWKVPCNGDGEPISDSAIEDGSPGKGIGQHIACFILEPKKTYEAVE